MKNVFDYPMYLTGMARWFEKNNAQREGKQCLSYDLFEKTVSVIMTVECVS
jgi:hypothetical protein